MILKVLEYCEDHEFRARKNVKFFLEKMRYHLGLYNHILSRFLTARTKTITEDDFTEKQTGPQPAKYQLSALYQLLLVILQQVFMLMDLGQEMTNLETLLS